MEKVYSSYGKALVHYIDYGNKLEIPFEDLAPLPDACAYAKPFAHEYGLACVQPPPVSVRVIFPSCVLLALYPP